MAVCFGDQIWKWGSPRGQLGVYLSEQQPYASKDQGLL